MQRENETGLDGFTVCQTRLFGSDSSFELRLVVNKQMQPKILHESNTALFHNVFYVAGTKVPILDGDKLLYNHSTGLISFVDNQSMSVLESGGIYTMELKQNDFMKRAPQQKAVLVESAKSDRSGSFFKAIWGKDRRKSDNPNQDRRKSESPSIRKTESPVPSAQTNRKEGHRPSLSRQSFASSKAKSLDLLDDKPSIISSHNEVNTEEDEEIDLVHALSATLNTSKSMLSQSTADISPEKSPLRSNRPQSIELNKRKGSTSVLQMSTSSLVSPMETVPPVFLEHHGPVKAQLTLTGPSAHYFHLKSSAIYIYASQEDMDKGKLIKEVKLENCVAIPSAQPTDFDIEFQDYTIACSVSSLRSKLTWVSMINSASLELSVHHAEHLKVLDQDVQQQLFNLEYEHLLETIKEFTGTEEPPKQKIVPAPEFPRSRGRQRSVYNGITCVNYNVGSDGIRQIFNINSITLQKWVERLTDQHGPDPDFAAFAIHCYRHICDPEQLMELLIERMHVDVPQTDYLYKWRSIIKLRVISFVCLWLRLAWSPDFVAPQNRQLLDKFLSCVPWPESIKPEPYEKLIVKTFARLGDHIHAIITKMERSYAARTLLADEKHDKAQYNMLTVDPHMIAFELTQKDHANLQAIKPLQLLVRLWQKESDPIIAQEIQPITDLINSINTTSFWVATEICTQPEIKNRVKMVEQFIKIAKECRKLNNFNSTMAIVSGLNLVSVSRLKSTWEQVDPKRGKQLAELESFLSPAGNYKNYRQQLSELDALEFKIPILSLFVKDLFFTNDGNPQYTDKVDEKSLKLINLDKLIGLYKKASSFCLEQRRSPPAKPPGDYQEANNAVHNMRALKEQPLYKYSLLCEPKQGDNETLRLREKWMQQ